MRNNFIMLHNSQKGVSLIITFFIMTIVLAVILAISAILYSELKIIRNMGNSVVAFFAADGGVEKVLYYDRKTTPANAIRGLCTMCLVYDPGEDPNPCPKENPDSSLNCWSCVYTPVPGNPEGCDIDKCDNCQVTFKTTITGDKSYAVTARTTKTGEDIDFNIDSTGSYKLVKRAINLLITKTEVEQVITVVSATLTSRSIPAGTQVEIQTQVQALYGISEVSAYIKNSSEDANENTVETLTLSCECSEGFTNCNCAGDSTISQAGTYYIDLYVFDLKANELWDRNISPFGLMPTFEVYPAGGTSYPTVPGIEFSDDVNVDGTITIEAVAGDISGVYSMVAKIKDSDGNTVNGIDGLMPAEGENCGEPGDLCDYAVEIDVSSFEPGTYEVYIVATDNLLIPSPDIFAGSFEI